jgi:hypothetical protein
VEASSTLLKTGIKGDALDQVPYTYTYPNGEPSGCCGGFYDDPRHSILNDGDIPWWPSQSNSIEWSSSATSAALDHDPLLDLGDLRWVWYVRVSYLVETSWGKYAPWSMTVRGGQSASSLIDVAAVSLPGFGPDTEAGAHTITIDTRSWATRVRYIELSDVEARPVNSKPPSPRACPDCR